MREQELNSYKIQAQKLHHGSAYALGLALKDISQGNYLVTML